MVDSKSTDKLAIICNAAKEILTKNPELANNLKSVSIVWKEEYETLVPNVNIEFYERSTLKLDKTE